MIGATTPRASGVRSGQVQFRFNTMVDFAIWLLQSDGLQVAPFDRHDEGHGLFRTMGADARSWRAWLHAIVSMQDEPECLGTALAPRRLPGQRGVVEPCVPRRFNPAALWPGAPCLRPWLEELWQQYGPLALERRTPLDPLDSALVECWLQEALSPHLQPHLERLHIHLVRYDGRCAHPVAPHAVVLGGDGCTQDPGALLETVRAAVGALTTRPDAR